MGNWNREMLNNGESREPGTCWLPATELVLSCCAQELSIRSPNLLCELMMDFIFFFSKLEGSSHCLLWSLFSTFSRMNMGTTDCDDSACYIQTNVLKIWGFVWIREKHKISVGGEHVGAEALTVSFFLTAFLLYLNIKVKKGYYY